MSAPHRIRRQRWQVSAPDAASAFALRQALHAGLETQLQPALAAVFDELIGERELHLPRLELHLRLAHPAALAEQLPGLLADAARQALAAQPPGLAPTPTPAPTAIAARPAARLRHYLRHGDLPWPDAWRATEELRAELRAEVAARVRRGDWAAFAELLPVPAAARLTALRRCLPLLDAAAQADCLHLAGRQLAAGSAAAALFAELRQAAANDAGAARESLLALALMLVDTDFAVWRTALAALLADGHAAPLPAAAWLARLDTAGASSSAGDEPAPAPASAAAADEDADEPGAAVLPPAEPALGAAAQPGEALRSAGLVLIHPWLPRLFAALGWLGERPPAGQPFPAAHLGDALRLLHWLASGSDDPLEFELGTAKLLLGLDPGTPLPPAAGHLDAAARAEATALLGALLEHWRALGSTSVDGLRSAFLQRAGLFYRTDDGWLLRPQPASYDLLLDRLPWGIGLIRLPWMPRLLQVDWARP